jgi:hypothetical protein
MAIMIWRGKAHAPTHGPKVMFRSNRRSSSNSASDRTYAEDEASAAAAAVGEVLVALEGVLLSSSSSTVAAGGGVSGTFLLLLKKGSSVPGVPSSGGGRFPLERGFVAVGDRETDDVCARPPPDSTERFEGVGGIVVCRRARGRSRVGPKSFRQSFRGGPLLCGLPSPTVPFAD